MARVFVSHANKDLPVAVTIRDWLRDAGHQVFLDRDLTEGIQVGEELKRRLHRELRAADAVVCVVTAAYTESQWCAAETGIADIPWGVRTFAQLSRGVGAKIPRVRRTCTLSQNSILFKFDLSYASRYPAGEQRTG